jgi:hypothetical protein
MSIEENTPTIKENTPVEVMTDNPALTKTDKPLDKDSVIDENQALIEAIQTKAFSEAQKADDFARDTYLEFIRNAREQVESLNLFDPDKIDAAMKQLKEDVEKDWTNVTRQFNDFGSQFNDFGDRLSAAAKAAWEVLTKSKEE